MLRTTSPHRLARSLQRSSILSRCWLATGRDNKADYVIVGAGSAGCVLARRLVENGNSVILLEAGGEKTVKGPLSLFTRMPTALSIPMHLSNFNWGFETQPAEKLDGKQVSCPRGRGLGGSSSINGMVYVRGHPLDFEAWKDAGATGWGWESVAPYFKRMESWGGDDDAGGLRGREGPLHVKDGDNALETSLFRTFIKAGAEAGYGSVPDYNGERQEGLAPMPMSVFHSGPRKGERCSVAASYLAPVQSDVDVRTNAVVSRVLWEQKSAEEEGKEEKKPRAVGIECQDGQSFYATRDVILSAGAIGSPHLLQVSGVGDRVLLDKMGVPCVMNLPGVGQNLMDHLEIYFQFACARDSLRPFLSYWRKALIGLRWILFRDGLGATNHFEAGGFIRSKAGVQYPDIQFHFLPVAVSYDGVTSPPTPSGHSFQLHLGCNRSPSRGYVAATSADVRDPPIIDFKYMTHDEDWVDFRKAIRLAREIIAQPCFDELECAEISPGADMKSDAELDAYLREHLESAYHPCGTCKMGDPESDPEAVVGPDGKVVGTEGLRVVDASIFPTIPNGNLNAPTIMVAEKMSDMILGNASLPPLQTDSSSSENFWVDAQWQDRQRESKPLRPTMEA